MNAAELARTAYGSASTNVKTDRGTEYAVFSRITRNLKQAADQGGAGFPKLVGALHENRKLWSILASDVASDDNRLPAQLRARIFYLAQFTQSETRKILTGDSTADNLIDINTIVMRGLRASGGSQR